METGDGDRKRQKKRHKGLWANLQYCKARAGIPRHVGTNDESYVHSARFKGNGCFEKSEYRTSPDWKKFLRMLQNFLQYKNLFRCPDQVTWGGAKLAFSSNREESRDSPMKVDAQLVKRNILRSHPKERDEVHYLGNYFPRGRGICVERRRGGDKSRKRDLTRCVRAIRPRIEPRIGKRSHVRKSLRG